MCKTFQGANVVWVGSRVKQNQRKVGCSVNAQWFNKEANSPQWGLISRRKARRIDLLGSREAFEEHLEPTELENLCRGMANS